MEKPSKPRSSHPLPPTNQTHRNHEKYARIYEIKQTITVLQTTLKSYLLDEWEGCGASHDSFQEIKTTETNREKTK